MKRPDLPGYPADRLIRALSKAIRKDDWTRIDAAWDRTRIPWNIHIRRDAAMNADAFLHDALEDAHHRGILNIFLRELIYDDLLTKEDLSEILRPPSGPFWNVQVFQHGNYRPVNALLEGKDLLAACDHVCRIDIDGYHTGTGVQVSEKLVATAAHVIEPLAMLRPDGSLQAAVDSLGRLSLTFCYAEDYPSDDGRQTHRKAGEIVSLHPQWLAWGSGRATSDEAGFGCEVTSIDGISTADGPWDVALIRLAEPRHKPRPTRLLEAEPPTSPFQINILHYPNGQPLLRSIGQLDEWLGEPGWPPVRCLHDASTSPGSSGAPVFDSLWRVVALHQGGTQAMPGDGAAGGRNRAVPVQRWRECLKATVMSIEDDGPFLRELTTSTDLAPQPYPVIGRRDTQRRVRRAMRPDAAAQDRLLIVRGEPGTGRRFTKRLVKELVSSTDGVMAVLDLANALDDSPAGFIERIAGVLSAPSELAGQAAPNTEPRLIRDDHVPALTRLLEKLAGGRAVWLVLEGFGDVSAAIPATTTDVIDDLIYRLPDVPSLRLVLVGWTVTPVGYETSVEELRLPTGDDLVWYLHPPEDVRESELVDAVQGYFKLVVKKQGNSYPIAQQIALTLTELLYREIDQGDGT